MKHRTQNQENESAPGPVLDCPSRSLNGCEIVRMRNSKGSPFPSLPQVTQPCHCKAGQKIDPPPCLETRKACSGHHPACPLSSSGGHIGQGPGFLAIPVLSFLYFFRTSIFVNAWYQKISDPFWIAPQGRRHRPSGLSNICVRSQVLPPPTPPTRGGSGFLGRGVLHEKLKGPKRAQDGS